VKVGDEIEVKILRVDTDERKIGLSRKRVDWGGEAQQAAPEEASRPKRTKPATELRGGLGTSGPLIQTPNDDRR
jgi:small subunit ribosomal protein S1